MRKLFFGLLAVLALSLPSPAEAGAFLEASLGKGAEVKPETKAQPINIMVAPGYSLAILKLQVGLAADLPDVENSKFDIGVRPMLTLSPPVVPLYARLILAVNNLTNKERRSLAYGGAVGLSVGLGGIGVFLEAGLLPRSLRDQFHWIIEGRGGVSIGF